MSLILVIIVVIRIDNNNNKTPNLLFCMFYYKYDPYLKLHIGNMHMFVLLIYLYSSWL